MAVRGERDVGHGRDALADLAEHLRVVVRRGVANRVRQIDRGGARFDRGCDQLRQEIDVAAGGIFRGKLHVIHITARQPDRRRGVVEGLLAGHLQLYLEMQIRTGEKCMDARPLGELQRMGGALYIERAGTGERSDHRAADRLTDRTDGLEIAFRGDRKARLQNVHAQIVERMRHLDLFRRAHAAAGRLLAVAQRGVKEDDPVLRVSRRSTMRHVPSSTASSAKRIA